MNPAVFRKSSLRQHGFTIIKPSSFSAGFQATSGGRSGISANSVQLNSVQFES